MLSERSQSEKATYVMTPSIGLKLNIQKTEIMASGPTTSWEVDGETVETVSDFVFVFFGGGLQNHCRE